FFHLFFFFNDTASTEIYTLSLHDALPICDHFPFRSGQGLLGRAGHCGQPDRERAAGARLAPDTHLSAVVADDVLDDGEPETGPADRKSTRLNSSHLVISYAVFCLKKKKKI